MGVVVRKGIFGGGVFSTAHSNKMRMIGKSLRSMSEFQIMPTKGMIRTQRGVIKRAPVPPFMPKSMKEMFHPAPNSVCYAIQLAHLMGCDPIYLMGFTLQSGLGYFFGRSNPATKRTTVYETTNAMEWLTWHGKTFPNRVRLLPGWAGPIYSAFPTEEFHAIQTPTRQLAPDAGRCQPGEGSEELRAASLP